MDCSASLPGPLLDRDWWVDPPPPKRPPNLRALILFALAVWTAIIALACGRPW